MNILCSCNLLRERLIPRRYSGRLGRPADSWPYGHVEHTLDTRPRSSNSNSCWASGVRILSGIEAHPARCQSGAAKVHHDILCIVA